MNEALPFIRCPRLYLRPLCEADAAGAYPEWFNDPLVCAGNSHHVFPYGREAALRFIRAARERDDQLVLAMVLNEGDHHIGNVALQAVHSVYRSAEFSIVIGDPTAWGKGYGEEAGCALLRHGFQTLNLHRIGCGALSNNLGMQRLARKLGMHEEGRRREASYKDGVYLDVVEYGILKSEFSRQEGAVS